MNDITKAILALFALGVLLLGINEYARAADAPTEGWMPTGAVMYLDVTNDADGIYCRNGLMASHLGARIPVWRHGRHTFSGAWVHNSCVEDENDRASRDALGIGYEYQLW